MDSRQLVSELLRTHPLISDQVDKRELSVLLELLAQRLEVGPPCGSVVEFGCYIGTTSLFIRRVLNSYGHEAAFHVYDSFEGLPDKTSPDMSPAGEQFKTGELSVSRKTFQLQFKKAGLRTPIIHKGWFSSLSSADIPDDIGFAYLDGDYFESVTDSLRLIWPKLAETAVVVVDDYANEALPGAARAVDAWTQDHPCQVKVEASLAIIYPA